MRIRTPLVLALSAIVGMAVLAGCGGSSNPRLANSEFVGKWVERPGDRPAGYKDRNFKREMELTEAGTFKITVVDLTGKPAAPARTAEGKFTPKGPVIEFTVTDNQLGPGEMDVPLTSLLIQLKARGHEADMIETRDVRGAKTVYVRE